MGAGASMSGRSMSGRPQQGAWRDGGLNPGRAPEPGSEQTRGRGMCLEDEGRGRGLAGT